MKKTPYVFFFSLDTTCGRPTAGLRPKDDGASPLQRVDLPLLPPMLPPKNAAAATGPDDVCETPTQSDDVPQIPPDSSAASTDSSTSGRSNTADTKETIREVDLISFINLR